MSGLPSGCIGLAPALLMVSLTACDKDGIDEPLTPEALQRRGLVWTYSVPANHNDTLMREMSQAIVDCAVEDEAHYKASAPKTGTRRGTPRGCCGVHGAAPHREPPLLSPGLH